MCHSHISLSTIYTQSFQARNFLRSKWQYEYSFIIIINILRKIALEKASETNSTKYKKILLSSITNFVSQDYRYRQTIHSCSDSGQLPACSSKSQSKMPIRLPYRASYKGCFMRTNFGLTNLVMNDNDDNCE